MAQASNVCRFRAATLKYDLPNQFDSLTVSGTRLIKSSDPKKSTKLFEDVVIGNVDTTGQPGVTGTWTPQNYIEFASGVTVIASCKWHCSRKLVEATRLGSYIYRRRGEHYVQVWNSDSHIPLWIIEEHC